MDDRTRHVAVAAGEGGGVPFYRDRFDVTVAFREDHCGGEYGDQHDDVGRDEPAAGIDVIDHLDPGVAAAELDCLRARVRRATARWPSTVPCVRLRSVRRDALAVHGDDGPKWPLPAV